MTTEKKERGPKLYDFTCDFQSQYGERCTEKVQATASAKVAHTCVDGKRKLLTKQDA